MSGLDTSGAVTLPAAVVIGQGKASPLAWSDLNPFTQGYVEALLGEARIHGVGATASTRPARFSDLAPEALARIMEDCAEAAHPRATSRDGQNFWIMRRLGSFPSFARLSVSLRDDGRVYLRDAPSPSSDRGGE